MRIALFMAIKNRADSYWKEGGFMARIDEIKSLCDRLAPLGWRALLQNVTHGELDISQSTSAALQRELTRNLEIDRTLTGFEDFAAKGNMPGRQRCALDLPGDPGSWLRSRGQAPPDARDIRTVGGLL
jgi:hypothetical protein